MSKCPLNFSGHSQLTLALSLPCQGTCSSRFGWGYKPDAFTQFRLMITPCTTKQRRPSSSKALSRIFKVIWLTNAFQGSSRCLLPCQQFRCLWLVCFCRHWRCRINQGCFWPGTSSQSKIWACLRRSRCTLFLSPAWATTSSYQGKEPETYQACQACSGKWNEWLMIQSPAEAATPVPAADSRIAFKPYRL